MEHLTLLTAFLLSLAVTIRGQCVLPLQWKEMFAPYAGQVQLWGDRPLTPTSVDSWELWMFANDNLLIDTQSGTEYICQQSQLDASTGFLKLFYLKSGTTVDVPMCFYGKLSSTASSNKVLFYKKSVETTSNAPKSLADCDDQTGIEGGIYHIYTRFPLKQWTYTHVFDVIPDGTYSFNLQKGTSEVECANNAASTLTKSSNKVTVSSPCIDTTDLTYGNPFGQELMITDSITDVQLGLGTTGTSGFLVLNNQIQYTSNGQTDMHAYRFYIVTYEIENGQFRMYMETNTPDLRTAGFWDDEVPPDHNPNLAILQSTTCLTNTNFCQNGGTCIPGLTSATCQCTEHYEGNTCLTTINKCSPNPCLFGGVCSQTGIEASCACLTGRVGVNCQWADQCTGVGATVCQNAGACHTYRDSNNVDTAWCQCVSPYTGDKCQTYNPCLNDPCQNDGDCVTKEDAVDADDYLCKCPAGYFGRNCENAGPGPCGSNPCGVGGASCDNLGDDFVCRCKPGYSGETCTPIDSGTCKVNPCKNDGQCHVAGDGVYCECSSFYNGGFCEEYEDWFIILLVLVILTAIIFFILIILCSCYFCCGWRPGSNKTPYETYADQMSAYHGPAAAPIEDTVNFNFVPMSQYQGITTTAR